MAKYVTFSAPKDKEDLVNQFVEVARREGGVSKVLVALIEDWVQKHASGNPGPPLDKWVNNKEFRAFPTLGEFNFEALKKLPYDMLAEVKKNAEAYMANAKELERWIDVHKVHGEVKNLSCPYCLESDKQ